MHLRIAASRASPCCAVCVAACGLASTTATNAASRPSENFPVILMVCFLSVAARDGPQPAPTRRTAIVFTPRPDGVKLQAIRSIDPQAPRQRLEGDRLQYRA